MMKNKVFKPILSNTSPSEIREKFGELSLEFSRLCAIVLVREIKVRANDENVRHAADEICTLLLPGGPGWNLFQSVRHG